MQDEADTGLYECPPRAEKIAEKGQEIYDSKYRAEYEKKHEGKCVIIDVNTGVAYLGSNPEKAIAKGEKEAPDGVFFLIRIGSEDVFHMGYLGSLEYSR